MTQNIELVDFHTHFRPPQWRDSDHIGFPADSDRIDRLIDIDRLARESNDNGIALRALSAGVEGVFGTDSTVGTAEINGLNEYLADQLRTHPGQFLGLATVNAFAGDEGAEQARYAIDELGLDGLFVDAQWAGITPGEPQARGALTVAAERGVPVFIHPVWAPAAIDPDKAAGVLGRSWGRGYTNGLSLLSLIHHGVFEELPHLDVVFTALGTGSLLFAADSIAQYRGQADAGSAEPLRAYFDTLRHHPPTLRYLVDVLGAERVVLGTDWPIRLDGTETDIVEAFGEAGFDARTQSLIGGENARRLFAAAKEPVSAVAPA